MMSPTDQVKALRLLRYAKANEPTTLTPPRRKVLNNLQRDGLVEVVGQRKSGTLLKLTKRGEDELRVLEEMCGDQQANYAASQAARRARTRR